MEYSFLCDHRLIICFNDLLTGYFLGLFSGKDHDTCADGTEDRCDGKQCMNARSIQKPADFTVCQSGVEQERTGEGSGGSKADPVYGI